MGKHFPLLQSESEGSNTIASNVLNALEGVLNSTGANGSDVLGHAADSAHPEAHGGQHHETVDYLLSFFLTCCFISMVVSSLMTMPILKKLPFTCIMFLCGAALVPIGNSFDHETIAYKSVEAAKGVSAHSILYLLLPPLYFLLGY